MSVRFLRRGSVVERHRGMEPLAVGGAIAVVVVIAKVLVPTRGVLQAGLASCVAFLLTMVCLDTFVSAVARRAEGPGPSAAMGAADGPGIPVGPARRALDLAVSSLLLVLCAPALVLIGLAIGATSRGPAIYRQVRVGQGGKPFSMLKFRTMRAGRRVLGPEVTLRDDPRITPMGRFLRAMSLDELPQLFNVLVGHMTLVGPRPETPALAARYPEPCRFIFRYRPGLTGPVQIHFRDADALGTGSADPEVYYLQHLVPDRVALDMGYLGHATIRATLALLGETVLHVAKRAVWQFRSKPEDLLIILPPSPTVEETRVPVDEDV
jgi:lipopolysaccharide/colanic/teichoic acid biosynthesis glycosyltransferase